MAFIRLAVLYLRSADNTGCSGKTQSQLIPTSRSVGVPSTGIVPSGVSFPGWATFRPGPFARSCKKANSSANLLSFRGTFSETFLSCRLSQLETFTDGRNTPVVPGFKYSVLEWLARA